MLQFARPLFLLLLVVAAILITVTTDHLPEYIASHFGANGIANGWMDHATYRVFMLAFAIVIPIGVVLVSGVLPRKMTNLINLPNRTYWMAPAQREATLRYLETHAYWLGSLLVVFVAAIHLLLIAANTTQPPRLPGQLFGVLMVLFALGMAVWASTLILHFRRTP
ncbi:MAG: DUF1648 domain-containing protein [Betaproteobacteria bacterium]